MWVVAIAAIREDFSQDLGNFYKVQDIWEYAGKKS